MTPWSGDDMTIRAMVRKVLQGALIAACLLGGPSFAQQNATPAPAPAASAGTPAEPAPLGLLEPSRLQLDQLEATIRRDGLSDSNLALLRDSLSSVRDDLRNQMTVIEQRLADVDARLKELGATPAAGTSENPTLSAERASLNARRGDLEAAVKQARLLTLRGETLSAQITERRRSLFAKELFVRTSSALDPSFWQQAAEAAPGQWRGVLLLAQSWGRYAAEKGGLGGLVGAGVTLFAFAVASVLLSRFLARRRLEPKQAGTRFAKAFSALKVLFWAALLSPLGAATVVLVLDAFSLLPPRIMEIGSGFVVAVAVASFGRAVALALFAPGEVQRRLPPLDDAAASLLATHMIIAARLMGLVVLLNVIQRAVVAPVASTVATGALMAILVGALIVHLLLRLVHQEAPAEGDMRSHWLRGAGWMLVAVGAVALATGYIGFAAFLASRVLVVLAVMGALYLLLVFTDALFSEVLTGETARGRAVAGFFGLKPRSLELIGTLLSAVIRLLLVIVVIFPLLGPWGIFAADFFGVVRDVAFGFRIGDITISVPAILAAFMLVMIGILATRAVQRWLQTRFLPRTTLEPSLQHSVTTILGYFGVVVALALALSALGIDLQKITLVAGALSIGIGFGLQSVVSNFVSGLILLTERPIRVGDMINVKGEEGYVRKISVRATEIETFERASVIIPNSELITGVVKNWTHANTFGRVIVKIGVGYDSDVERVRDLLSEVANAHPQVLQSPPPKVYLVNFGERALEFELRCVVRNVQDALSVKSDLGISILARLQKERINIPLTVSAPPMETRPDEDSGPATEDSEKPATKKPKKS